MALTAVAAVARNGVIGLDGRLPWHIGDDMRHFRQLTMGGALIMGRATYQSLGRPLPGRVSIVLSHQRLATPDGAILVTEMPKALEAASYTGRDVFVVGGAQIYALAWPHLTDLALTLVDENPQGDASFPAVDPRHWEQTSWDARDGFAFAHYRRRVDQL